MDVIDPRTLRPHYSAFVRPDRVLMSGHSHQAWPDVAREGLLECFADAAEHVDEKWGRAAEKASDVRAGVVERIGGNVDEIALGANTHELVARFLSALPLARRRHLVTTAGEFHSLDRQLRRLAEAGVEVTFVPPEPLSDLPARLAEAIRSDTAALLVSTVLFETSSVVPDLTDAVETAQRAGAEVLLDAYHAFNVLPFSVTDVPDPVFVVAGGYKYAQWGEGCCFMRVPSGTELRPVFTGWFSDFANLDASRTDESVRYGARPSERFAGSTYDPSGHYRASRVLDFFAQHQLSVGRLREISLRQTSRLIDGLGGFNVATPREASRRGGFVSVRHAKATELSVALRDRGIRVDARGELLRFGPAPYTTDEEIDAALDAFRGVAAV
jgi:kynureninase